MQEINTAVKLTLVNPPKNLDKNDNYEHIPQTTILIRTGDSLLGRPARQENACGQRGNGGADRPDLAAVSRTPIEEGVAGHGNSSPGRSKLLLLRKVPVVCRKRSSRRMQKERTERRPVCGAPDGRIFTESPRICQAVNMSAGPVSSPPAPSRSFCRRPHSELRQEGGGCGPVSPFVGGPVQPALAQGSPAGERK